MKKYVGGFNQLHNLKKRCNSCVDKLMTVFGNSLKRYSTEIEVHQLIQNNNKPEDITDSVDDNKYDVESDQQENLPINNEEKVIEVQDDDSESSKDEDKEMCDSTKDEEEDEKNVDAFITHNQITDHSLDNRNDVGTPFSFNKIKYVTKSWKQNNFLNVSKLVGIFWN